ncbi:pyrroline-5-carboxylate reductase [Undibacterium sp. LX40W]|uniref:Pyrroline-5-carboxylate reductase n=1 Tax=Undibacterium nitidum TaxID=2762298 RepID=A0A923KL23_9BURK|nr:MULTISPECIES: pyrroline-5-carboxylate reductase [Undibacterium]MBC3881370.1 pyrroline-5-carboxylate reductase [Undibacterium nitidum]MBC3891847.1 pyrroline-5-carboxylate reductase [Undibacterium sp. LX40W]
MQSSLKIGFIGGGNMASALISGLVKVLDSATQIHVVDLNPAGLDHLRERFGVSVAAQMDESLRDLDVVVFAVKPQSMREVMTQFSPYLGQQLLLSVAAGIRASDISRWLKGYPKIARAMPNTPAMLGLGMSGLFGLDGLSADERQQTTSIMQAVGKTVWVQEESMIDAVTAVSGSGPAYVFYFIEALQEAAIKLGFNAEDANTLALQTFRGAAELAISSNEPVNILRERVTSKGGTTYAALCSFDDSQIKTAIELGVTAAAQRGKQLGDEFGQLP